MRRYLSRGGNITVVESWRWLYVVCEQDWHGDEDRYGKEKQWNSASLKKLLLLEPFLSREWEGRRIKLRMKQE